MSAPLLRKAAPAYASACSYHAGKKPLKQLLATDCISGAPEHQLFLLVHRRLNLLAVENRKSFHHRMGNALVTNKERMIEAQRATKCRCLFFESRIGVDATG